MPRYYKNKIYDENTRILVGAKQREKMLMEKNKQIEKVGIVQYEETMRQLKNYLYKQQQIKSAATKNNKI